LVLVAAYGGLRWGELVGLRVKRVDLLHGRVTVAEQVAEVNGQLIPGPPKTEAGRRTITLPAVAAVALAEHLPSSPSPARRGGCSGPHRAAIFAGRTSAAAGGCRP
jgi:integrase